MRTVQVNSLNERWRGVRKMQRRFLLIALTMIVGVATTWHFSAGGSRVSDISGRKTPDEALPEFRADGNSPVQNLNALPVEIATLHAVTEIDRRLNFTGTVFSSRRSALAFERSGRLQEVLVEQGNRVQQGQSLAVLDFRQLKLQLSELTARREQQQAILDELLAGPRPETIAAAEAEVAALSSEAALRRVTFERTQQLFDRKASGEQLLDESRFSWRSTESRRDAAARRLDELRAGTRKEQLTAQQAAVAILDVQLERLRTDLSDSTLISPFDGRIVERMADEGSMVSAQQPIVELLETERLEVRIGISTDLAGELRCGQQYSLTVGAVGTASAGGPANRGMNGSRHSSGRLISATLRDVLPRIDTATRTQTVLLDIDKPFIASLADGELVQWELSQPVAVDGYRVPISALSVGTRGLWLIYVARPGDTRSVPAAGSLHLSTGVLDANSNHSGTSDQYHVQSRPVEVLLTDGEYAVIRGAVQSGEKYVVNGSHRLVNGQRVAINTVGRPDANQAVVPSASGEDRN